MNAKAIAANTENAKRSMYNRTKQFLGNTKNALNTKLRTPMDIPTIQLVMMILVFILVGVLALCIFNPLQVSTSFTKYISSSSMILVSLFMLLLYLSMNPKIKGEINIEKMKLYLARFLGLFTSGIGFTLLAMVPILFISSVTGNTLLSGVLIVVGTLILITTTTLIIYAFFHSYLAKQTDNSYAALLKNTILYIPCLIIESIEWLKQQYNLTTKSYLILLIFDIVFIVVYFNLARIEKILKITNETVLLDKPIYLTSEKTIGYYEDLKNANKKVSNKEDQPYVMTLEETNKSSTNNTDNENNNENNHENENDNEF